MANKVTIPFEDEKPTKDSPIGKKIDYIRRKRNLKQEELAEKIGIKREILAMYETNKRRVPIDILTKIAIVLKIPTDYLLGLSDIESYNISNNAIHKALGLNEKSIQILKTSKNNSKLIDTINFLIEQEEVFDNGFSFKLEKGYTKEEQQKEYEKTEEKYYKAEEKWQETHFPIIQMISNYLEVNIPNGKLHITKDSIKKENDFENQIQKYIQTKGITNIKGLTDIILLSNIQDELKKAKNHLERRKNKEK